MALTIDYLPIANSSGANVESQVQYVADLAPGGSLQNGYESGIAKSVQVNKTLRQSSMVAAAVASFIAQALNSNILDDGNLTALTANMASAVRKSSQNYADDTGAANAYAVALMPAITAYSDGLVVTFKAANTNTGASTLNAGGGAVALVTNAGGAVAAGDIKIGGVYTVVYDAASGQFFLTGLAPSQIVIPVTFPSGTRMIFQQTAAPTGWTKETNSAYNDAALRLVTGDVVNGGTNTFSATFSQTATQGHALATTEMPSHNHSVGISDPGHVHGISDPGHSHTYTSSQGGTGGPGGYDIQSNNTLITANTGASGTGISIASHTTGIGASAGFTGGGAAHTHNMDMRVLFIDHIIAIKN